MSNEKKKIVKSELVAMFDKGMTRVEIAAHYGMPVSQLKKAIVQLGMSGVRTKLCMFEVEDDTIPANQTEITFKVTDNEPQQKAVEVTVVTDPVEDISLFPEDSLL